MLCDSFVLAISALVGVGRQIQRVGHNGYPGGDPTDIRFSGDVTGGPNGYNPRCRVPGSR